MLLATAGVVLRKAKSRSADPEGERSEDSLESGITPMLQSMAQWFGVGLTGIAIILAVAITAFVLLALYAIFRSGSLFS